MANFPASVEVKDIKKTHCEYYPELIRRYTAAYEGGHGFKSVAEDLLIKRELEQKNPRLFEMRLQRSDYINRAGGLLDFLKAAVFKSEPMIVTEPENEYWFNLNADADGLGTSLPTLLRDALLSMTVNQRSYLLADFRESVNDPKAAGSADARMRVLDAEIVDDWGRDELGALTWVRLHTVDKVRENESDITSQPDVEHHKWIYITATEVVTYEATSQKDQPLQDGDGPARIVSTVTHDFGELPVFEIKAGRGQWVMDRIFPVVKSLFNRESALTWQLDRQAFSQLVLNLLNASRIKDIMSGESSALLLEPGENAGYITPPNTSFEEQFKDVDRLTKSLYEVVQALALNASATQTQNARQSAKAKEMDRDPLQTLLQSFAWPILSALNNWIEAVKAYRNDRIDIKVIGLDAFTVTMEDLKDGEKRDDDRGTDDDTEDGGEAGEAAGSTEDD